MDRKRYDLDRLRTDLRLCAETISGLKKQMRRSHYTPTMEEHLDLAWWKKRATVLCCLRAHHRDKLHLRDEAKNLSNVYSIRDKYLLKEAEAA